MKRVSKEPTLQQQLREMCNCNIDTSPCGAELECRACFNAADLLDECARALVGAKVKLLEASYKIPFFSTAEVMKIDNTLVKLRTQEEKK